MSAGVAIRVGDLVMPKDGPEARMFTNGTVRRAGSYWAYVHWVGQRADRVIPVGHLARIPFTNPYTDAAHLPKLRPLQRVLFDRFTDRDMPATARAMLRPWRWGRWRKALYPRDIEFVGGEG